MSCIFGYKKKEEKKLIISNWVLRSCSRENISISDFNGFNNKYKYIVPRIKNLKPYKGILYNQQQKKNLYISS